MPTVIDRAMAAIGLGSGDSPTRKPSALPGGRTVEAWVKESKADKPGDYDDRVRRHLAYYRGWGRDDVVASLAKMFPLTAQLMQVFRLNIVRLVIDEQARVFAGDPQFDLAVDDGEVSEDAKALWSKVLDGAEVHRKLVEVNRLVRGVKRGFVRVTWDADSKHVRLTRFAPDKVHPLFALDAPGNFARCEGVLLELASTRDAQGSEIKRFEFWSAGKEPQNFIIDAKGAVSLGENDGTNPYVDADGEPVIPLVSFGDADEDDGYWLCPPDTLIDQQRAIDGLATNLLHVAKHQGFGQWVFAQTDRNADSWAGQATPQKAGVLAKAAAAADTGGKIQMGPETPIRLPSGWNAQHVAQEAPLEQLLGLLSGLLKHIATSESIPAGTVLADARTLSGVAMMVDRLPLIELRRDQVELYRRPTLRLLDMIRWVWSAHNPNESLMDYRSAFTPGEIVLPADPAVEAQVRQADLRDGLTSAVREIAKRDRLSLEDATKKAAEIQQEQRGARAVTVTDVAAQLRARAQAPAAAPMPMAPQDAANKAQG